MFYSSVLKYASLITNAVFLFFHVYRGIHHPRANDAFPPILDHFISEHLSENMKFVLNDSFTQNFEPSPYFRKLIQSPFFVKKVMSTFLLNISPYFR